MDNLDRMINIFSNKDLRVNLDGAAYFILIYEAFIDMIECNVKSFYEDYSIEDGKLVTKVSPEYKTIVNKIHKLENGKSHKCPLYSYLEWFESSGAIDAKDVQLVKKSKLRRNDVVHTFFDTLQVGLTEEDAHLMSGLLLLYMKIDNWFFKNYELPIMGDDEIPKGAELDSTYSMNTLMLKGIYEILFLDKGKEYEDALNEVLNRYR